LLDIESRGRTGYIPRPA